MHMFDMEIPKTIEEAHELYEESDTDYWGKSTNK